MEGWVGVLGISIVINNRYFLTMLLWSRPLYVFRFGDRVSRRRALATVSRIYEQRCDSQWH